MRSLALLLALIAAPSFAQGRQQPIFITLGTGGGPVVQVNRSQPANAVLAGNDVYLFDAGEGTQRQMKAAGLPLDKIEAVFLSHHHLDHVGGLLPLIINRWIMHLDRPLRVFGPPGTRTMVEAMIAAALPIERAPLSIGDNGPPIASTVMVQDLPGDLNAPGEIFNDENIHVSAVLVDHYHDATGVVSSAHSYAFRIEGGGRAMVFTGDTGPSVNLEKLARRADLLVAEVVDRPAIATALERMSLPAATKAGYLKHMQLDHLSPVEVGELARAAAVKRVVLTHLVPGRDGESDISGYTAGIASVYRGPVTVAHDGERF